MKILVTGGNGFIGSHLVSALLDRGENEIFILDREKPKQKNKKIKYYHANLCDNIDEILENKFDIIFHLAAEVGSGLSMADPKRFLLTNTYGTANLFESMRKSGKYSKVIAVSSATVYGEATYECKDHGTCYPGFREKTNLVKNHWEVKCPHCEKDMYPLPIREERPLNPGNIYGLSKLDTESICINLSRAWGFPTVVFRPFGVFGPGQSLGNPYTGVLALFATWVYAGHPIRHYEDGNQRKGYIYIDDAINALVCAMDNDQGNGMVFNLGIKEPVSITQIANQLVRQIDNNVEIIETGKFRTGDTRHSWPDISLLQNTLPWEPKFTFDDGLSKLLEWFETIPKEVIFESIKTFDKAEKYAKSFGLEV